jgi:WD40 repeat protein
MKNTKVRSKDNSRFPQISILRLSVLIVVSLALISVGIYVFLGRAARKLSHTDVIDIAFSPTGETLASAQSSKHTIQLWQVSDGSLLDTLDHGYGAEVWSVEFSPSGKILVSGAAWHLSGESIRLWNVSDGSLIYERGVDLQCDAGVHFSPDGSMLAFVSRPGGGEANIVLWHVSDGTELRRWKVDGVYGLHSLAFSPDGEMLAAGSSVGRVRVWRISDGHLLRTLEPGSHVTSVAFSPDGSILASAHASGAIVLWEVNSGKVLHILRKHKDVVRNVAFSSDGKTLASASHDGTVKLWRVGSWRLLRTLKHPSTVMSVAFSPDGSILASGSEGVRLWNTRQWWPFF